MVLFDIYFVRITFYLNENFHYFEHYFLWYNKECFSNY
jgi:hypothetical protein